jgi:nucleoside 2-deoxyribosyltransferase
VVVLDGLRLNVLYELGYAHGSGKPTLLLNRARSLRIARIPFDIAGQQRIEYETLDDALAQRLQTAIARLKGGPAVSGR